MYVRAAGLLLMGEGMGGWAAEASVERGEAESASEHGSRARQELQRGQALEEYAGRLQHLDQAISRLSAMADSRLKAKQCLEAVVKSLHLAQVALLCVSIYHYLVLRCTLVFIASPHPVTSASPRPVIVVLTTLTAFCHLVCSRPRRVQFTASPRPFICCAHTASHSPHRIPLHLVHPPPNPSTSRTPPPCALFLSRSSWLNLGRLRRVVFFFLFKLEHLDRLFLVFRFNVLAVFVVER